MSSHSPALAVITTQEWIATSATLAVAIALAPIVRRVASSVLGRLRVRQYVADLIGKLLAVIPLVVGGFYALAILDVQVGPLLGALGVGGVVIAFALQSIFVNLVGSVLLHARRPFRPGDQILTNGFTGTVLEINARTVILLSYDGTYVHVPNMAVLDEPIVNLTKERSRRTVLPISVAYATELRTAQRVIIGAVGRVDGVEQVPPVDAVVTGFGESGIDINVRFWHPSEELVAQHTVSEVAIVIHEALAAEGIVIPYPQRVLHLNTELRDEPPLSHHDGPRE